MTRALDLMTRRYASRPYTVFVACLYIVTSAVFVFYGRSAARELSHVPIELGMRRRKLREVGVMTWASTLAMVARAVVLLMIADSKIPLEQSGDVARAVLYFALLEFAPIALVLFYYRRMPQPMSRTLLPEETRLFGGVLSGSQEMRYFQTATSVDDTIRRLSELRCGQHARAAAGTRARAAPSPLHGDGRNARASASARGGASDGVVRPGLFHGTPLWYAKPPRFRGAGSGGSGVGRAGRSLSNPGAGAVGKGGRRRGPSAADGKTPEPFRRKSGRPTAAPAHERERSLGVCSAAEAMGEITRASAAARRARAHLGVYSSRPDSVGRRGGQHVRDRGGHGRGACAAGDVAAAPSTRRATAVSPAVRGELRAASGAGGTTVGGAARHRRARPRCARTHERGGRVGVLRSPPCCRACGGARRRERARGARAALSASPSVSLSPWRRRTGCSPSRARR